MAEQGPNKQESVDASIDTVLTDELLQIRNKQDEQPSRIADVDLHDLALATNPERSLAAFLRVEISVLIKDVKARAELKSAQVNEDTGPKHDELDTQLAENIDSLRRRYHVRTDDAPGLYHEYSWSHKLDQQAIEWQYELAISADSDADAIEEWTTKAALHPEAAAGYNGRQLRRLEVWTKKICACQNIFESMRSGLKMLLLKVNLGLIWHKIKSLNGMENSMKKASLRSCVISGLN